MKPRPPSSLEPLPRPKHAPDLVLLFAGHDWQKQLKLIAASGRKWPAEIPTPALALPPHVYPAAFHWPVAGRYVLILGSVQEPRLHRLMSALTRDGALNAAGLDTDDKLHTASDRIARAAA